MIIVKFKGGLGNQIFQYSFGLNLSRLLSRKLFIDLSYYKRFNFDTKRNFDLLNYPIEIDGFCQDNRIIQIIDKYINSYHLSEINFNMINLNHYNKSKKIIIDGYWQGEKYFTGSEYKISKIFNNFVSKGQDYLYWKKQIESTHSTSIHVRRGDYVQSLKAAMVHEVCNLDYYNNAIKLMRVKNNNTKFFIFTDDINWVKKNFDINEIYIVSDSKINHCEELSLMSKCYNNIISNSTFSWWGAWLNENMSKYIICPKKWYKDDRDISELIPSEWHKI